MRRYIEWIIRYRLIVVSLTLVATGLLVAQVRNLRVIIDPNNFLPSGHPYVVATDTVEQRFGSEYVAVIGVTAQTGTVFQPHVLQKLQRMTTAIQNLPGVVKGNVLSLTARKAKNIVGTEDGMDVHPLIETVPQTPADLERLRQAVHRNDAYVSTVLSPDDRTTAIIADFKDPGVAGFTSIVERLAPIIERERDETVHIGLGGLPSFLSYFESNAQRMVFLFPLAVLITGLIHYEAFRTVQGLVLPLVTALMAVMWALGIMGFAGVPMDVFNITTPILILAVAAGHAVQILKRYYEEYHALRHRNPALDPRATNHAAVVESIAKIGPVMLTAGIVAACSFLSLLVFKLSAVRTFGVFTGLGILSALVLEMTLIPALRSWLRPPSERERQREQAHRFWDRLTGTIARWVTGPSRRYVFIGVGLLVATAGLGASRVVVDEAFKDMFFQNLPVTNDDALLNHDLGGTNTVYVLVEGESDDALKRPENLRAIEKTQQFLESQPHVGKTLSVADFIKRMNRSMHGDDPAWNRIPDDEQLVSQYLLLYSMSGDPGDFDTYVDYGYRSANIWAFLKTDSNAYFSTLAAKLTDFAKREFPPTTRVSIGGSVAQAAAVRETIIEAKTLNIVQIVGVVLIITAVVFRSFAGGLLVLVPLVAAVLANFGVMGWFGIPLNAPNSLTSAMAVGIGADYAIYLIYRIREELKVDGDPERAIRAALSTAGKAILFVASAVAGGYAVLLLSHGFYFHIWMAILIGTAMLVSSFATLTIIPALVLALKPRFVLAAAATRAPSPAAVSAGLVLLLLALPSRATAQTPDAIMEGNFMVTRVIDSTSDAHFTLINKEGQTRERRTFSTTKLQTNGVDNRRMTRFTSPPDVEGTSILLVEHSDRDDDIWIYLPGLKKVRRLVASNKKDSFAGTDFTYGDVIGHRVQDWEHRLVKEETIDGQPCFVIESTPRTADVRATSGYGKRLSWIRKDNYMQVAGEFWDTAGEPLKATRFSDIKLVDAEHQRWQAMHLEAANSQTGHKTVIVFDNFRVNQQVKDDFFTARYMETAR